MEAPTRIVCLVGETASGKGGVGHSIARALGAEIVSLDSMKVYRGMDVGTNKPPGELREGLPYHLLDVRDPWESFSVAEYVEAADAAIAGIVARGRLPLLVGGTPLYLKGLLEGIFEGPPAQPEFRSELRGRAAREGTAALHAELARVDPAGAERIHPNDLRRIERGLEVFHHAGRPLSELQRQWREFAPEGGCRRYAATLVGLRRERDDLRNRINRRVDAMFAGGLLDEVRRLVEHPKGLGDQAAQAVGYKEVIPVIAGKRRVAEAAELVKRGTRLLAKQQRTWFRRFADMRWISVTAGEAETFMMDRVLDAIAAGNGIGQPAGEVGHGV